GKWGDACRFVGEGNKGSNFRHADCQPHTPEWLQGLHAHGDTSLSCFLIAKLIGLSPVYLIVRTVPGFALTDRSMDGDETRAARSAGRFATQTLSYPPAIPVTDPGTTSGARYLHGVNTPTSHATPGNQWSVAPWKCHGPTAHRNNAASIDNSALSLLGLSVYRKKPTCMWMRG
ncbi:hypothetical protein BaRGS_00023594, partial [Batillaria attramentaria]